MIRNLILLSFCLALSSGCASSGATTSTDPSVAPGVNDRYATAEGRASAIQIPESEGRDTYQKPVDIIQNLNLEDGDVVCEVGAGTGYFTP